MGNDMKIVDAPYIAACEKWGYKNPPKPVFTCDECGEPVYKGSRVSEINGKLYCEECLSNMPLGKLLRLCGENLREV